MFTFSVIYLLFVLLLMGIPVLLIYKVIRKSLKKPTATGLVAEREQMRAELYKYKHELQPWDDYSITLINNNLQYAKRKWTARQAKGKMNTFDNNPLVAFKFIERGLTDDGHLFAVTSSFDVYVKYDPARRLFYFNGRLLGEIDALGNISDAQGTVIGTANRKIEGDTYNIILHGKKLALVSKGKNLDNSHHNPFYNPNRAMGGTNVLYHKTEFVERHRFVRDLKDGLNEEERQWVYAIALYEAIYHSIYII